MSNFWPDNKKMGFRRRLYSIVEVGDTGDVGSRFYDMISAAIIICNLIVSVALTFSQIDRPVRSWLETMELLTYLFFAIDFGMRLFTAGCRNPRQSEWKSLFRYLFSFIGIVDLFSFLPYFLPIFFPAGTAAFRMFRVIRIFRLFRINNYYDSLNVITEVIRSKKQQLLSSVFIILVLMLASSLCMYSLEHEAQPEVFQNAFSGIWWSVSTLLTVGYGDIYPITTLGRIFSIIITFLGVGMVAIPTGIISAGFVDQYSRAHKLSEYGEEAAVQFLRIPIEGNDTWCGLSISELALPKDLFVSAVYRGNRNLIPRDDLRLESDDLLILAAASNVGEEHTSVIEYKLQSRHPWVGKRICDLDISRKTILSLVRRNGELLPLRGDLVLQENDIVIVCRQMTD